MAASSRALRASSRQRCTQLIQPLVDTLGEVIQALIGARGHRLQLRAEAVDALALLQGEAVQLAAQFVAPTALFVAQQRGDAILRPPQQQQRDEGEDGEQQQRQQERVGFHPASVAARVAAPATAVSRR